MASLYNEQFLPAELQSQIGALRAAGVPDDLLSAHITTILEQMEAKTTRVQLDVWRIEESLGERVEKALQKNEADLRSQLGETNGMLSDLLSGQRTQEAATLQLRAEFQQIGEHITDNRQRIEALEVTVAGHDAAKDRSIEDRRLLRQDMDASIAHRAHLQRTLDTELPAIKLAIAAQDKRHAAQIAELTEAVARIEALLELAGDHEAGR